MIHPDTELRFVGEKVGHGVFATRDIPRGTITWVRDKLDQAFSADQIRQMREPHQQVLGKYGYTDRHGKTILCWDHGRFMNHSCEATCLSAGYDFEVAIRDVRAGEELTDDYSTLNLESGFACACSRANCRGQIQPDDNVDGADLWDAMLRETFPLIQKVTQPLWWLVDEKEEILRASSDVSHMRSCRLHFLSQTFVNHAVQNGFCRRDG